MRCRRKSSSRHRRDRGPVVGYDASKHNAASTGGGGVTNSTRGTWLLASDLDGTLIPTGARGREETEALARFRELVERGCFRLAYVTGRHLELALSGIDEVGLPMPDAIASDVGTTLHWRERDRYAPDEEYRRSVAAMPGVPVAPDVRGALEGVAGLRLQEDAKQARFKVSYYFDGPFSDDVLNRLERRLRDVGRVRLVHSRDPDTGVGLLDVLPADVGKETAVRFVRLRLGDGADRVVFAGDSGNDRAAILSGCRAIVVGNAPRTLKDELRAGASERSITDRVHFAESPYAAGVLEGLAHHGVPGCA